MGIFKLIKLIFKIIGLVFLLITIFPIIVLLMAYKDVKVPDDLYSGSTIKFEEIIGDKLNDFLADDTNDDLLLTFTTQEANDAILASFLEINPNYLSTDSSIDNDLKKYVMKESIAGIKGAWVYFTDNGLTITTSVDLDIGFMVYKTSLKIGFEVTDSTDSYTLKLNELTIGNFPTLWMYNLADFFMGMANQDLGTIVQQVLPIGEFDSKEKSLTITRDEIIDLLVDEDDENKVLIESLISLITEERLISFNFTTNSGGLSINLGRIRSSISDNVVLNPIATEAELNQLLESQITSLLLANLTSSGGVYLDISESTLNQIIDFYTRDSLEISQEFNIGINEYIIESSGLYATLSEDLVTINLLITLMNKNNVVDVFKTHIEISSIPVASGNDLLLNISDIKIGDNLSLEDEISIILDLLNETGMVVDGSLVIEDFFMLMVTDGLEIDDVIALDNFLRFNITITNNDLQNLIDEVKDLLDDALNIIAADYPELEDLINDAILNGDPTDLLEEINNMTPQEQSELFNDLFEAFNDLGLDINDLLP